MKNFYWSVPCQSSPENGRGQGAFIVDLERLVDEQGFFARFVLRRLAPRRLGIEMAAVQGNISWNEAKQGTLLGMHYQGASAPEPKLIGCTQSAIWDVIVDLRSWTRRHIMRHVALEASQPTTGRLGYARPRSAPTAA